MERTPPKHTFFKIYLAVVMTLIMLFLAAILALLIYGGITLSNDIQSVNDKASDVSSKIDSFNQSVKNFKPF